MTLSNSGSDGSLAEAGSLPQLQFVGARAQCSFPLVVYLSLFLGCVAGMEYVTDVTSVCTGVFDYVNKSSSRQQ